MRRPGSPPVQAILLFCGIVLVIGLATRYPSRFLLLQPDILGAALFLYAPFLHYRRGRAPEWVQPGGIRRSAALFFALGAAGSLGYFLFTILPFGPASPSVAADIPPFGEYLFRQAFLAALPEEVFFRGYLYDAFEENGWEPVTASAALFALGHLAIHPSAYRALTFLPALLFGWSRKKSGNIYVPVLLHLFFNLLPYLHEVLR